MSATTETATASWTPSQFEQQSENSITTLTLRPRGASRQSGHGSWFEARQRLGQIATLRSGWNGSNAAAVDPHTLTFAAKELVALQTQGLPAPAISPAADGSLYAEWHMNGIDAELIFEAPYEVILLAKDALGELRAYEDADPDLTTISTFLHKIQSR